MENNKYRVGQKVRFDNHYAYPSLSGKCGVIETVPNDGYPYYGFRFTDRIDETVAKLTNNSGRPRMAVCECELTAMED